MNIPSYQLYWQSSSISISKRLLAVILFISFLSISATGEEKQEVEEKNNTIAPPPTEILADKMTFDMEQRKAVFTDNVRVIDEQLQMSSDTMVVQFNEQHKLIKIEAQGNVVITSDGHKAMGEKASYHFIPGKIILSGNPILLQGNNRIIGAKNIIYSRDKKTFDTEGGKPKILFYGSKERPLKNIFTK